MGYGFADVEAALAEIHGIADEKRSAFSNRLKHLQRLGFPPGVNTGRGRAATYYAEHAFLLGVALQLNEISVSPERAIKMIESSFSPLAGGASFAIEKAEPVFCEVPALSLMDLVYGDRLSEHAGLATFDRDFASKKLELMLAVEGPMRWAIFSLSGLITRLSELLADKLRPDGFPDFKSRLLAWASEVGGPDDVWKGQDFG